MNDYEITITETQRRKVFVEAESAESAVDIATEKFIKGDYDNDEDVSDDLTIECTNSYGEEEEQQDESDV
jgi:hypothetical protein